MADEQALRDQGAQLLREGKAREAVALLRQATEQNPQDEGGWRLLGVALGQSHDPDGSVTAFQKTVALVPTSAKNHYNLAVALQVAERGNEARQHLEKALALDPSYEQARLRLRDLSARTAPAPMGTLTPATPAPPPTSLTPVGGGGGGLAPIGGGLQPVGGGLQPVGGSTPEYSASPGGYTPPASLSAPPPATGSPEKPLDIHEGIRAMGYDAYRGMQGDVDSAVRGFNFGALVFGPIWMINHGMREVGWGWIAGWVSLGWALAAFRVPASGLICDAISFLIALGLAFVANRIGWESRSWDDVDDFKKCQRIWMGWGIAFWALIAVLFVTVSTMVLSLLGLSSLAAVKSETRSETRTIRGPDGTKIQMKNEPGGAMEIKMPDGSTARMETGADGSSTMRMSDGTVMQTDAQGRITVTQPGAQNPGMQPGGLGR